MLSESFKISVEVPTKPGEPPLVQWVVAASRNAAEPAVVLSSESNLFELESGHFLFSDREPPELGPAEICAARTATELTLCRPRRSCPNGQLLLSQASQTHSR